MPVPRIFIADMDAPNAFATGRDPARGVLCFTRGILSTLSEREMRGVISHELAHIKNRDTLLMTITASIASTIMMLSSMARWAAMFGGGSRDREGTSGSNLISLIVISVIAPLAAMLIQMAISRSREYMADESGAKMTGDPEGLATALLDMTKKAGLSDVSANPQTALLFIVSPFGKLGMITNLFSTHPPVEERVKRLRSMTS
jgi:heat shock protein HtpX